MIKRNKTRSAFFRLTKYSLVFVTIITAFIAIYFIIINQNNKISHKKSPQIEESKEAVLSPSLKANSPDLVGLNLENGPYYITADEIQELSGHASFTNPKVKLMLKHIDWLNLVSEKANLTTQDHHLQLFDNVKANLNMQYYFESNQAEIFAQESTIKSDQPSKLYTSEYNVHSTNGFIIDYNDKTAFFHGKIDANIKRDKDQSRTNIKSDRLDIFWQKKIGHFIGNVMLTKESTTVKSDKMTAIVNTKTNQLEKILCFGNVNITDKKQTATGLYGEYIVATSILTLKDKVSLKKDGNILTGELLHYNFNFQQADLVGASQEQGNKRVKAIIIPKKQND